MLSQKACLAPQPGAVTAQPKSPEGGESVQLRRNRAAKDNRQPTILGRAPEGSIDSKIAEALMYFSGGAMAGLLSALIAYINRTVSLDGRERPGLRRILLTLALAAVIGSGAAFVTGMYLVGDASAGKTRSHPKGADEK